MEILIGIVLVLLAFKLIAELAGFFIGMFVGAKIAKMDIFNEDKDKDKQYEDIHAICSSHDCNNNNLICGLNSDKSIKQDHECLDRDTQDYWR